MKTKINISYQCFDIKAPLMASHIRKCIAATLEAEKVNVPCEINVLITDDVGIHGINLASRNIDRPTDVLSFPMFQLEPGILPADWEEYKDPETQLVPLGDGFFPLSHLLFHRPLVQVVIAQQVQHGMDG